VETPARKRHDYPLRGSLVTVHHFARTLSGGWALERPFDPDARRLIDYTDHAERYGTELDPHEAGH
jgi:hypothetical protein